MPSSIKTINTSLKALFSKDSWKTFFDYVGLGKHVSKQPLSNPEALEQFLKTRASHVAQTSLYGYLKTRAGTRFPEMFEDPGLLLSMNMAKWQIWLACLSDLAVYVGALIQQRTDTGNERIAAVLSGAIDSILDETGKPEDSADAFESTAQGIRVRIANTDYSLIGDDETAFRDSPESLYHWAPIADELKSRDREIVINSVRFRWKEIRQSVRDLLRADELLANRPDGSQEGA